MSPGERLVSVLAFIVAGFLIPGLANATSAKAVSHDPECCRCEYTTPAHTHTCGVVAEENTDTPPIHPDPVDGFCGDHGHKMGCTTVEDELPLPAVLDAVEAGDFSVLKAHLDFENSFHQYNKERKAIQTRSCWGSEYAHHVALTEAEVEVIEKALGLI